MVSIFPSFFYFLFSVFEEEELLMVSCGMTGTGILGLLLMVSFLFCTLTVLI